MHPCSAPFVSGVVRALLLAGVAAAASACGGSSDEVAAEQAALVEQGRQIFRFDTFGDEAQWTDALRLHEVIEAAVDPLTALSVGLKVDADALPPQVVDGIRNGSVDLQSRLGTTLALLKLDAVVGVRGTVETVGGVDRLQRVGITCALCHSTVDDSFARGIGKRLNGWPNRDLNPGAIIEETLRQEQIVGRIGGEEFVVLLPDTSPQQALIAVERVRKAIGDTPITAGSGVQVAVTVSGGIASLGDGMTVALAMQQADKAMYRAKALGRNRVEVFGAVEDAIASR